MKRRSKIIIIVIALVLSCFAFVMGATYGLFDETVSTKNHLVAGTLNVTLVRQKLTLNRLGSSGYLESTVDSSEKDFSGSTQDNIFGIEDGKPIAPGSSFAAEMRIENKGDVAFYYYVEVVFNSNISDSNFASMLRLTVLSQNGTRKETLIKDGLTLGDDDMGLGVVEVGGMETFTVTLEFLHDPNNNKVENKFVLFDLMVHAVQKIN